MDVMRSVSVVQSQLHVDERSSNQKELPITKREIVDNKNGHLPSYMDRVSLTSSLDAVKHEAMVEDRKSLSDGGIGIIRIADCNKDMSVRHANTLLSMYLEEIHFIN